VMDARPKLGTPLPKKVAVFRALQLGDLLAAVPALRALRAALPGARIILIGLPWAREFVGRFAHLLDGFREFPGWPGLPEQPPRLDLIPGFLGRMQADRFDLVVQLHGSGPFVNPLCVLFGGKHTAGFYLPGDYCPDPDRFIPWPAHGLERRRLLAMAAALGCPPRGEELEFPLREPDREAAARLCPTGPGGYACIHPGASVPERRWPPDRFAAVAAELAAAGLRIVLTGAAAEAELTRAVAAMVRGPVLDLAGRTPLGTAAAVIARATLMVCNDTGVSHIAEAVGTPSVVISTGDNPARWAPIDSTRHRVLCRPGGLVPTAEAIAAALGQIENPGRVGYRPPAARPAGPKAEAVGS
jgi:ADP-heptose:LPS heptosyltransferase